MSNKYEQMSASELVSAYNAMATSAEGKELGKREIRKFESKDVAVARCRALESSIKASLEGKAAIEAADKRPAKVKKERVAKERPAKHEFTGPIAEFQPRAGTLRVVVLEQLLKNINKQVTLEKLINATYGKYDEELIGPVNMVLKGVKVMIEKHGLSYKLVRERKDKVVSVGLFND